MTDFCAASESCQIALKHVAPSLGVLTSLSIYFADWKKVQTAINDNNIGSYNVLPNAITFIKSFAWALYGLLAKDYYIFCSNFVGINICMYYCLSLYHIIPSSTRKSIMTILLIFQPLLLLSSLCSIVIIAPYDNDGSIGKKISGWTGIVTLLFFFIGPLLKMQKVIKSKDASSISLPLALTIGVSCIVWGAYGFAIRDQFISLSSMFGIFTVMIQLALISLYKKSTHSK